MTLAWYTITLGQLVGIVVTTLAAYLALVLLIRVNGLRSFSKLSSYDFAITVAMGSVLAATVLAPSPSLLQGIVALAALLGWQHLLSRLRTRFGPAATVLDNSPLLLMRGPEILDANLRAAKLTEADLYAKLREAGVLRLDQVCAVVLESTGDVSVLAGDREVFDEAMLHDVRDGP